jgi:soluble lytic murein transglycosylase-like protein
VALALKIPSIEEKFYPDYVVPQIKNRVSGIRSKYGNIINHVADLTGLNSEIIDSFVFIESGGDAKAHTPQAVGLLQVGTSTASDALVFEKSSGRLSSGEEQLVKKYLGKRWSNLENLKPNQKSIGKTFITREDLFNPTFNLLVGSIILKQLTDEYTENGKPRLDKVVVVYNTGRFSKASKTAIAHKGSTQDLVNKLPKGQADYIRKLLGVNGTLDILA